MNRICKAQLLSLFIFTVATVLSTKLLAQIEQLLPMPQVIEWRQNQLRITLKDTSAALPVTYRQVASLPGVSHNAEEAYHIIIGEEGITVWYLSEKGAFYALQTLRQLAQREGNLLVFPYCTITDWPAFPIRGFMHDVGRSFIPADQLIEQLKRLSAYKINTFHWHLTEDIAWRLASDRFPALTAPENALRFPGQYYTKSEVQRILEVARVHHITVIPEIDMPGHSDAFRRTFGHDMQSPEGMIILKTLLEEAGTLFQGLPWIHLGTDEVRFGNPEFVPEMSAFIKQLGFEVISWNPGWDYREGEVALQQLWSYRGRQQGNTPVIDSKFHYINHYDPFADLISLYRSNVLGKPQSDSLVWGAILAVWNDRKLDTPEAILLENNFYPLLLTLAERLWRGGGSGYFDEIGVVYPEAGSQERVDWENFERRLLHHQATYFARQPFPYTQQSGYSWQLLPPMPNQGKTDSIFPLEKLLLAGQTQVLDTLEGTIATGASIYLRHVWGDLIPAYLPEPLPDHTAYAYTWIYSPDDREAGAWISFQDYSRSEKDLPPPQGKWDWRNSQIWVNGQIIDPPVWENTHRERSSEIPLKNENFQSRSPTLLKLRKGWNHVVLKLPVGSFTTEEVRLVKWMFTFALPGSEALFFSPTRKQP
ncbi:MAG: beta-N-acetylhexosaminidase [Saprospiraceae bacterium]|nr:beta-N-acetylhexosaminidase [Saprospiraceae bacterium]